MILAETGSGISPVLALAGNVLVAGVAFVGVLVAQRATSRRELETRFWDRRLEVYVDLVRFALDGQQRRMDKDGLPRQFRREDLGPMDVDIEMQTRVQAFASDAVRNRLGHVLACRHVALSIDADSDPDHFEEMVNDLSNGLTALHAEIREELRRGSLQPTLRQKAQHRRWQVRQWWRRMKRKRSIRAAGRRLASKR